MSRGLSNRNPGNIRQSAVRYKGEVRPSRDPAFKQFESMPWGYRAIFVLLDTYRIRHGLDTIRGMISRWAPPSENHTEIYIRAVADAVGIATLASGMLVFFATHGRHPAWCALLVIATLVWWR